MFRARPFTRTVLRNINNRRNTYYYLNEKLDWREDKPPEEEIPNKDEEDDRFEIKGSERRVPS